MSSSSFLVASLEFSVYSIISSANSDSFILLFQFGLLLFLLLLWLPWLELPKLCWIKVVKVDILVLSLTLEEMLSIFAIEDNVYCGFVVHVFYYVEVCSFSACFLESFHHKWVLNFVKTFSTSIEIMWFLFFNLLMWCITLIDLRILKILTSLQ